MDLAPIGKAIVSWSEHLKYQLEDVACVGNLEWEVALPGRDVELRRLVGMHELVRDPVRGRDPD